MDMRVGGSPETPEFRGVETSSSNTPEKILREAGTMINPKFDSSTTTGTIIPTSVRIPPKISLAHKLGEFFGSING